MELKAVGLLRRIWFLVLINVDVEGRKDTFDSAVELYPLVKAELSGVLLLATEVVMTAN